LQLEIYCITAFLAIQFLYVFSRTECPSFSRCHALPNDNLQNAR